ncbi:HNH endonuclease [Paenibacillus sp. FSL R10-2791]|uniref:AP2 domain-containing protein n=1 Tax=Paenibacillus sp. FSL R10-2791 TaxID=2954695 RepID=UPI0030F53503
MKNEYKIVDDIVTIYLKSKGKVLKTIIDLEDFDKANSFTGTWHACFSPTSNSFYVYGKLKSNIKLHRLLCNDPKGSVVDHINHDTLDNRRSVNLRILTHAQNMQNLRTQKSKTSKYRGVCWNNKDKKWKAQIKVNGKKRFLGNFDNEPDAAKAAQTARIKYFPYTIEKEIWEEAQ